MSFFAVSPAMGAGLSCLRGLEVAPERRPVGVETIHRTPENVITIFVPLPATSAGRIADLNSLSFDEKYPARFIFSDGSLLSSFIEVDLSEGSRLSKCVDELADRFQKVHGRKADPLPALVTFFDEFMDPIPAGFRLPWETSRPPALPPEFAGAADLPVGHYPLTTKITQRVVPLEAFLKEKRGVCVQRVLFVSLLMKKLGMRHRVRAGGMQVAGDGSGGGGGHVWVELPDRRHLDPTWHLLEKPSREGVEEGWFRMDRTYLFRNQVFPIIIDE
ncbi:MAG: transglutaminase domain-containing protein [Proteobacteria bacterium]|nr:MAG: transglutaminase domain-containing protein [Pseudomonadota bacterium]